MGHNQLNMMGEKRFIIYLLLLVRHTEKIREERETETSIHIVLRGRLPPYTPRIITGTLTWR
jgi:hypothetical protein